MTTAYITHAECLLHEMGTHHPERPDRLRAIEKALRAEGLWDEMQILEAPRIVESDLLKAHTPEDVRHIIASSPKSGYAILDPDTSMNSHSLEASFRAAGAAKQAVNLVMQGEVRNVFCAIRPPGHHAESHRAMGFCLFNNVAIAARYALEQHAIKRVAIIDFDVHHGNGTEEIFKNDDRVMLCSSFQHPFYPYSPLEQIGTNANIIKSPLSAGADGDDLKKIVMESWWPKWQEFQPELVLISAGFDAHRDDPLGGLKWVEKDFSWVTKEIGQLSQKFAQGKVVSCLEGGYDLEALGRSAVAHISQMNL